MVSRCSSTSVTATDKVREEPNFVHGFEPAYLQPAEFALLMNIMHSRSPSPAPPAYSIAAEQLVSPQELLDWINIPDLASQDVSIINEKRQVQVPPEEQARAEHLIQTKQFQDWLVTPNSSQLLIHGNYNGQRLTSGLSLFCTSFIEALTDRAPRFIHLMFFCGLHEDPLVDDHTGGYAIIKSFICQLLCQFDFGTTMPASVLGESDDLEMLCAVFEWLVHRLPRSIVLICIIDGVVYYERPWFFEDMGAVVVNILSISAEQSTEAAVKVLVTSPTKTVEVRRPFPDDLILSMDSMARPGWAPSRLRLERQLREDFGERLGMH